MADPMDLDLDDIKAGAAEFSSLSTSQKYSWVRKANRTSHDYRTEYVKFHRMKKKQSVPYPHLHIKEMMELGDLNLKEAKYSYKEFYIPKSFEDRLQVDRIKQLQNVLDQWVNNNREGKPEKLEPEKFAPGYNEEYFIVTKYSEFRHLDVKEEETTDTLDPELRKHFLAIATQYKSDAMMMRWREEKIPCEEIINLQASIEMYRKRLMKIDDGVISETRSEILYLMKKKEDEALKKRYKKKKKKKGKVKRSYH